MFLIFKKGIFFFLMMGLVIACSKDSPKHKPKVFIAKDGKKHTLYRDGKPFVIKGAAGYTHLDLLAKLGGNTVRTWDTTGIDSILKKADKANIAVIVGLPIPESPHTSYYNDTVKTGHQYRLLKKLVNRLKHHPSVLMWCVGNELVFPYKLSNKSFYTAFNKIVSMIHHDDPDHPVTTTVINFQRKEVFNIKMHTDIDLISFNMFGRINTLKADLDAFSWFWNGPYLITEWGIDGPWEGTAQTAWGSRIEPSSSKKAEQYLLRYKMDMPYQNPRFLGSFIFFWGQKQETTHTWFSLFDEKGNKTEAIAAAEAIWKGKPFASIAPKINYMLLNGKGAQDNVFLAADQNAAAEVLILDNQNAGIKNIEWEIYPEDWFRKNDLNNTKRPKPISGLIKETKNFHMAFTAPENEGPYRIFATIYDHNGNISTCNTPFYVLAPDEKSKTSN